MRHQSASLNAAAIIVSIICIIAALIAPDFTNSAAPWMVLVSVFLIGIPHGAIDHIMAAELYGLNQSLKDHLLFYGSYLFIMFLVAALWYIFPAGGMILFLAISIYHFGQADMEDFMIRKPFNWFWHLSRGTFIIGLIIFSNPEVTYPIIAEAVRIDLTAFYSAMPDAANSIIILITVYIASIIAGISLKRIDRAANLFLDSALIALLIMITGPLIGFAVYFALWHSAGHVREMREFFSSRDKSLSLGNFYLKSAPFTIVSILGLALLAGINNALGLDEQFLTLMFILISVLTLPHMVIVHRMYEEKRLINRN